MANVQASAADVLSYRNAPTECSFRNRIIGLIALAGVGIDLVPLPLALGVAALASARFTDLRLLPLLVVVFLALGVSNMTNDIIDAERDKMKWPLRPLATGLLSRSEAVLYLAILSAIGIIITIVVFNWLFLVLGLLVLVLNYVYAHYTRDAIGYLAAFVIALFVSGIAILLYAQLSWLFAVVLGVLTVWLLIQTRNLGDNRLVKS